MITYKVKEHYNQEPQPWFKWRCYFVGKCSCTLCLVHPFPQVYYFVNVFINLFAAIWDAIRCISEPSHRTWTLGPYSILLQIISKSTDIEIKVKLSRYTPWMVLGGRGGVTSGIEGGERPASRPGCVYTRGEKSSVTHCTEGWVGLTAGLDTVARGKIMCLCRGLNPGRPVRNQTLYWRSYPAHWHWNWVLHKN
jgi:hypothetical protein